MKAKAHEDDLERAIRIAAETDPIMARLQNAWGDPIKDRAQKQGARWIESDALTLQEDYPCLEKLYNEITDAEGCTLGASTRAAHMHRRTLPGRLDKSSGPLAYGELTFQSLAIIFDQIRSCCGALQDPESGGCFVDIGSGSGKVVLAAALLHGFKKARGIEIVPNLHQLAVNEVQPRFELLGRKELPDRNTELVFQSGDLTKSSVSWEDADVVFSFCAVFDDYLMRRMAEKSLELKKDSVFITSSRPLPPEVVATHWEVVSAFKINGLFGLMSNNGRSSGDNDDLMFVDVMYLHKKL